MNPGISIIVPNRNFAKYIRDALESVLHQTFKDWECIIIDDASTDDSVEIIKEYMARDKRFRLIQQKSKKGPGAARNIGIMEARGKYIMFLDSDDAYTQTAAESLYSFAEMHNVEVVTGKVAIVYDDFKFIPFDLFKHAPPAGFYIRPNNYGNFLKEMVTYNGGAVRMAWCWSRIFKKSFIADCKFPENFDNSEDVCWIFQLMPKLKRIAYTDAVVAYHRLSPDSITRKSTFDQDWSYLAKQLDYMAAYIWPQYPAVFEKACARNIAEIAYKYVMKRGLRDGNREQRANLARQLQPVYEHPSNPTQYLSFRERLEFRLFVRLGKINPSKAPLSH